jgi:hypothetical protein
MSDRLLGLSPADVAEMPREAMPALLVELAALQTAVAAQLAVAVATAPSPAPATESNGSGAWLTPEQAATIAVVQRRIIYGWSRRKDWRAFCRRLSRKVLRIEDVGFRAWLASRK